MPRNGTGTFVLTYDWENDDAANIPIQADRMMGQEQDIADALTQSLATDGQTTPTANLTMGNFRLISLGAATAATDAAQLQQAQTGVAAYVVASGTDTYAITPSPALGAYTAGVGYKINFTNANTGASTLNVSGLGAVALTKNGATALAAGDISAGMLAWAVYDGTRFQLIAGYVPTGPFGLIDAGVITAQSATAHVGQYSLIDCSASARTVILQSALQGQIIGIGKFGGNPLTISVANQRLNNVVVSPVVTGQGATILQMTNPASTGFVEIN